MSEEHSGTAGGCPGAPPAGPGEGPGPGAAPQGAASGDPHGARVPLAVVGIGASAGGLDALKELFLAMPRDSGMAFVVVQHLEPAHESQMAEILGRYTRLQVTQAAEGALVQADCVYTIPAGKSLSIDAGRLRLCEPLERHGMRMAIDVFLRSLAEDQREKAVGIILSGSGTDGTHGVRAVRSAGGTCMAQDPRTAQFDAMPRSAISTGLVDCVLPAGQMPQALLAYVRHSRASLARSAGGTAAADPSDELESIVDVLRSRTDTDYRCYKKGTIVRRVQRRMGLKQVPCLADYLTLLRDDPQEAGQLAADMLIGVSSFFRDPAAFDELRRLAIGPLVRGRDPSRPLRAWVPGCATGEEAYSVAILLLEELEAAGNRGDAVQVFASDVDDGALQVGRAGIYPGAVAADLSPERLERFFSRTNEHYQVGRRLREAVVFAHQNLLADPPFSKVDLITCRNVLIYLQPEAQGRVISLFSFALNVGGCLFLGKSETLTDPRQLFQTLSKPGRIYRLARPNHHFRDLPVFAALSRTAVGTTEQTQALPSVAELTLLNQQMLLQHFGAALVLVDARGTVLHFFGQIEKYLGHPTGPASLSLYDMAAGVLSARLRGAVGQALSTRQPVAIRQVPLSRRGGALADVTVSPVPGRAADQGILAVILQEAAAASPRSPAAQPAAEDPSALAQLDAQILVLQRELVDTNQEHEAACAELKAANEEVMSMNEELQSTNEELETSKEELQSINEELNTVNVQLNEKVGALTDANNDLANLFSATDTATVFLDSQLRIKRFTPQATRLLNLLASDVGRPLGHITQTFDGQSVAADAATVMRDLSPVEREVQTPDGHWYTMRVLPYRTLDDGIDGAVVTFAEVTRLKRLEASLQSAKAFAEGIVDTVSQPLLVLDAGLRLVSANPAFCRTFGVAQEVAAGRPLGELGGGQWDVPELHRLLQGVALSPSQFEGFQVAGEFPGIGPRIMHLGARRLEPVEQQPALILLAIEDVTEREQARQRLVSLAAELEQGVRERTAELRRTVSELELIYNGAPAGLCLLDAELRYVRINERLAAMNGRPVAEHVGRTVRDVVPHVADAVEADLRRVLASGQAMLDMEGTGLMPVAGGRPAHWLASFLPVKSPDGAIVGLSVMVQDITERRRAQDRASATNALLALFARETTRAGYLHAVVALLAELAGCRCVGLRIRNHRNEIPYEASVGLSPGFLESESRLELGQDECACTRVVTGRPLPCDRPAMTPAGSFVCNDTLELVNKLSEDEKRRFRGVCVAHGLASVAVIPLRFGEVALGAIHLADERPGVFAPDVVEFLESVAPLIGEAVHRFDVKSELRHSAERYRSLVAASAQIEWRTTAEGLVVDDLPSWRAFTGQTEEETQGWGWMEALHPDDRAQTAALWCAAVATRSPYRTEYRIRRADGEYRDFAVRGVPVAEPEGTIREWVGSCTDITERKRADAQLHTLNEALARRADQLPALAATLTLAEQQERKRLAQILHDGLQQLLVAATYRVQSARQGTAAGANPDQELGSLESLLAEALALSRTLMVELGATLVAERGLGGACQWLAQQMEKMHGLRVVVTAENDIPADAEGVATLLFQGVRELLLNVAKHAGVSSATVLLRRLDGGQVHVEVADQGAGFDPGASAGSQDAPTGLGLFGLQERLAHLGGRVEVESAPGQGTRVGLTVALQAPVADGEGETMAGGSTTESGRSPG
ncbi:MAG: chemotaxis protein CheB [Candidatus Latescibacterota bacterium]